MQEDFNVVAEVRTDVGKGASRRLRRAGKVPGVIYGSGKEPVALTVAHNELIRHLEHEAFYSHILTVTVDGNAEKAVLKDLQRHPAKPTVLHVDFQRVGDDDVIHMHVPVHFLNEDTCVGVKAGGLVSHLMTSVDVACKAKDLPEFIAVDIAALEVGASLHLSDIDLPAGVTLTALAQGEDHDLPVVSVHAPRGGGATEDEAAGGEAAEEGGDE